MSTRTGSPAIAFPVGPIAVTLIDDCDPPSWLMLSGIAATVTDRASPDGPVSDGPSLVWTVQPTSVSVAIAAMTFEKALIGLEIPEVSEINLNLAGDACGVAGLVMAIERNARDRREDLRAILQLNE